MENKLFNHKEMLHHALKNGYAIGGYNFSSVEMMRAIVDGCQETDAPVILSLSQSGLKFATSTYLKNVVHAALELTDIPISLHLDHGKNFDIVKECIDIGFNSVMIDGSYLPYEENVALTKKVVDYAHKRGVAVEGELGKLAGVEDDVSSSHSLYTDPNQAFDFVKRTGVDSLAIAIGTSHGAFKFTGKPTLKFDILAEVRSLMPDLPIVLHGASNVPQKFIKIINKYGGDIQKSKGVSESLVEKACSLGVCKVNNDTDLRVCYTASIREYLAKNPKCFTPREYLQYAKDQVKALIMDKNTNLFHSAGMGKLIKSNKNKKN